MQKLLEKVSDGGESENFCDIIYGRAQVTHNFPDENSPRKIPKKYCKLNPQNLPHFHLIINKEG